MVHACGLFVTKKAEVQLLEETYLVCDCKGVCVCVCVIKLVLL